MKKNTLLALASAALLYANFGTTNAFAGAETNTDIEYQASKPKHGRKIEAAAIEKVAAKIGDLRGSLEGDLIGKIISEDNLANNNSSQLGFPIIQERSMVQPTDSDAVPIV